MPVSYRPDLKHKARRLRARMTEAERVLWQRLRRRRVHGIQFYRQRPLGDFVVDFYGPAAGLVIEIDGSQHFTAGKIEYDHRRTGYLESLGLSVLRFDNRQVLKETDAVMECIHGVVGERIGGGGKD